jgi:hypothetical protein
VMLEAILPEFAITEGSAHIFSIHISLIQLRVRSTTLSSHRRHLPRTLSFRYLFQNYTNYHFLWLSSSFSSIRGTPDPGLQPIRGSISTPAIVSSSIFLMPFVARMQKHALAPVNLERFDGSFFFNT